MIKVFLLILLIATLIVADECLIKIDSASPIVDPTVCGKAMDHPCGTIAAGVAAANALSVMQLGACTTLDLLLSPGNFTGKDNVEIDIAFSLGVASLPIRINGTFGNNPYIVGTGSSGDKPMWTLSVAAGQNITLFAIKFVDGHSKTVDGGALRIESDVDSHLALDTLMFLGNSAPSGGAVALKSQQGTVSLFGCSFFENRATAQALDAATGGHCEAGGAGMFIFGDPLGGPLSVKFDLVEFSDNNADLACGGGLLIINANGVLLENVEFSLNGASVGGGLFGAQLTGDAVWDNLLLIDNHAGEFGGGAALFKASHKITRVNATLNGAVRGGALYLVDTNIALEDSVFVSNEAKAMGGAIYLQGHYLDQAAHISNSFEKNTFLLNLVTDATGRGGGFFCTDAEVKFDEQLPQADTWCSTTCETPTMTCGCAVCNEPPAPEAPGDTGSIWGIIIPLFFVILLVVAALWVYKVYNEKNGGGRAKFLNI